MSSTSFFGDAVGYELPEVVEVPLEVAYQAALTVVEKVPAGDLRRVLDQLGLTERLGS